MAMTVREAFDGAIDAYVRSPWWQRAVAALYWACMLALCVACARLLERAHELALVGPAALAADALSAAVHVYFDHRPIRLDAPVAARWVSRQLDRGAYTYQTHHADPLRFVRGMTVTATYGQLEILAFFTIPLALATCLLPRSLRPLAVAMHATNAIASSTQVIHWYAHVPASHLPRAVKWAQDHGLVISRAAHARHHATHDRNFAGVTGWCNPLLNMALARLRAPPRVIKGHLARARGAERPEAPSA
jgi:hypothetical protein